MRFAFTALVSCVVAVSISAADRSPFEICPTMPGVKDAEKTCLEAIREADRLNNSELLSQLLVGLATIYEREHRYEEAIAALQRSISLESTGRSRRARERLADVLEQSGDLKGAVEVLHYLVAQDEGTGSRGKTVRRGASELQLADIYVKLKEPGLAERYYKRSIEDLSLGPAEDSAYPPVIGLVVLYLQQARVGDAVRVCKDYKESVGETAESAKKKCERLLDLHGSLNREELSLK